MAEIGEIRMGYTMQPCDAAGRWINGGNHYANADTIEHAREFAARVLAGERYLGYVVSSVEIVGQEWRFTGVSWRAVAGGRYEHEVVRREQS